MARKKTAKKTTEKKEHSPGIQKRMQNLVQYRKAEKDAARAEVEAKIEDQDVEIGAELVVMKSASLTKAEMDLIPMNTKAVLNKEEYAMYIDEVKDWVESHPDWDMKEDKDDIHNIAMERVIQFRLLKKKKNRPNTDIEKEYQASAYRMQTARQNLAARRTDRISGKGRVTNVTNIAILASELDGEKVRAMKERMQRFEHEEEAEFQIVEEKEE